MTEQPTQTQIKIVKQTWGQLRILEPELIGDVFFGKLILDSPEMNKLLKQDQLSHPDNERNEKLIEVLSMVVSRLDRPGELKAVIPLLNAMLQRMKISASFYQQTCQALLWTLQQGLGSDWNPGTRQAWEACIDQVFEMWTFSKQEINQT